MTESRVCSKYNSSSIVPLLPVGCVKSTNIKAPNRNHLDGLVLGRGIEHDSVEPGPQLEILAHKLMEPIVGRREGHVIRNELQSNELAGYSSSNSAVTYRRATAYQGILLRIYQYACPGKRRCR